jgi:hypothetical protein
MIKSIKSNPAVFCKKIPFFGLFFRENHRTAPCGAIPVVDTRPLDGARLSGGNAAP